MMENLTALIATRADLQFVINAASLSQIRPILLWGRHSIWTALHARFAIKVLMEAHSFLSMIFLTIRTAIDQNMVKSAVIAATTLQANTIALMER